jgi:hypothetical protein
MHTTRTPFALLAASAAVALFALPIAGASLVPVAAPKSVLGTNCTILLTGSCTFSCNSGDFIRVDIFWTGIVSASCGGAGADCTWGADHLITMTPCHSVGGRATSSGTGTCTATLVVLTAVCGASP